MTETIVIFVPGEARGKQRSRLRGNPKPSKDGRIKYTYTPKKTEDVERIIGWEAKKVMAGRKPFEGPLYVDITATYAYPKSWSARQRKAFWKTTKPDRDNIEKLALDALNKIVFLDDSQLADGRCRKHYTTGAPGLRIEIQTLD